MSLGGSPAAGRVVLAGQVGQERTALRPAGAKAQRIADGPRHDAGDPGSQAPVR